MLKTIKRLAKNVPGIAKTYYLVRSLCSSAPPNDRSHEEIFRVIFRANTWKGRASASGTGSDLFQTRKIVKELPLLFNQLDITSLLDIPCGDFFWMRNVDLGEVQYIGADIVRDIINQNNRYEGRNITFQQLDLTLDSLPKVDLILCRDALVHFSFEDIFRALENMCRSGSRYILMTTFPARKNNLNVVTGQWRVLNFEIKPFGLPPPMHVITEGCTEGEEGEYEDKSLGLWKTTDIINVLAAKRASTMAG